MIFHLLVHYDRCAKTEMGHIRKEDRNKKLELYVECCLSEEPLVLAFPAMRLAGAGCGNMPMTWAVASKGFKKDKRAIESIRP